MMQGYDRFAKGGSRREEKTMITDRDVRAYVDAVCGSAVIEAEEVTVEDGGDGKPKKRYREKSEKRAEFREERGEKLNAMGDADSDPGLMSESQRKAYNALPESTVQDSGLFRHPATLSNDEKKILVEGLMHRVPLYRLAIKLHCSRAWLYKKVQEMPELHQTMLDAREGLIDELEFAFERLVKQGNPQMIMFGLERLGKHRGWGVEDDSEKKGGGESRIVFGEISEDECRQVDGVLAGIAQQNSVTMPLIEDDKEVLVQVPLGDVPSAEAAGGAGGGAAGEAGQDFSGLDTQDMDAVMSALNSVTPESLAARRPSARVDAVGGTPYGGGGATGAEAGELIKGDGSVEAADRFSMDERQSHIMGNYPNGEEGQFGDGFDWAAGVSDNPDEAWADGANSQFGDF